MQIKKKIAEMETEDQTITVYETSDSDETEEIETDFDLKKELKKEFSLKTPGLTVAKSAAILLIAIFFLSLV